MLKSKNRKKLIRAMKSKKEGSEFFCWNTVYVPEWKGEDHPFSVTRFLCNKSDTGIFFIL